MGTIEYLAPEQAVDSNKVDISADIYALGGTLYFLLTGQPPFNEQSRSEKIRIKQRQRPTNVNLFRPDIPKELGLIIDRMLSPNPKERFQTPIEVYTAMELLIQGGVRDVEGLFRKCDDSLGKTDASSILEFAHDPSRDSSSQSQYHAAPLTQRMHPPMYGQPTSVQMPAPRLTDRMRWRIIVLLTIIAAIGSGCAIAWFMNA